MRIKALGQRGSALLGLALLVSACAQVNPKQADELERKRAEHAQVLSSAWEAGRDLAASEPRLTERMEQHSFAATLWKLKAPMAGARRLLDLREREPKGRLFALFVSPRQDGRLFDFEEDEAFVSGNFFNAYDPALYSPFFRQALLQYVQRLDWDAADFRRLGDALEVAAELSPRFAGSYPNQLSDESRQAMTAYLASYPQGPLADRMRFLQLSAERDGAWPKRAALLEAEIAALSKATADELLKQEADELLAARREDPSRYFWMSLGLPGLGQAAQGDLQGATLLGGLSAAAWVWLVTKLVAADRADDDLLRRVSYGDAAFAGSLAILGHAFAASNAAEQARFTNITVSWDLLSKPRLR